MWKFPLKVTSKTRSSLQALCLCKAHRSIVQHDQGCQAERREKRSVLRQTLPSPAAESPRLRRGSSALSDTLLMPRGPGTRITCRTIGARRAPSDKSRLTTGAAAAAAPHADGRRWLRGVRIPASRPRSGARAAAASAATAALHAADIFPERAAAAAPRMRSAGPEAAGRGQLRPGPAGIARAALRQRERRHPHIRRGRSRQRAARETAVFTQRTLGQSGASHSISPEKLQEADSSEALRTRRVCGQPAGNQELSMKADMEPSWGWHGANPSGDGTPGCCRACRSAHAAAVNYPQTKSISQRKSLRDALQPAGKLYRDCSYS
ncbi:uncharacterized protein LOC119703544 [Motacilla alba alba]|uniref:uncharacterized protein LOC119703544 n=1 Tax=Motacilla alba alba TaxID=1094192 RepID=UPI0018D4DDA5|nr:uncharacterized protein LOC119703544 [Motacilla alba alba]